jgi:hypothetical protein
MSPKDTMEGNLLSVSVRLPIQQLGWLKAEGDRIGSVNQVVRDLIHDRMNMYALPEEVRETLEADRQQRDLDERQYVVHLFMDRYKRIIKGEMEVSTSKKPKK